MKKIIENNKCLYFLKELLKYKKEIGILSISTIVSTVTVFLQPLLIKQITDIGILEKNMPQIVNGVAGLFVCVLFLLSILFPVTFFHFLFKFIVFLSTIFHQ